LNFDLKVVLKINREDNTTQVYKLISLKNHSARFLKHSASFFRYFGDTFVLLKIKKLG
jgi:hypothetical protein